MLLLGIDLGSSSVKASVIDGESGKCVATAFYPKDEMKIIALKPGWAEQETEVWWTNLKAAICDCTTQLGQRKNEIGAIGISYQMHGLVTVDKNQKVLRPSIIWCDSRAVGYGEVALISLTREYCLSHLLNSPGNFTASVARDRFWPRWSVVTADRLNDRCRYCRHACGDCGRTCTVWGDAGSPAR